MLGRLIETKQFDNIVLKTGANGQNTYLRDVARTDLGARNMDVVCTRDGKPSAGLAIFQLPGSNALDVAKRVKDEMEVLSKKFPQGLHYAINYDTTPFIEQSVDEVLQTLFEARTSSAGWTRGFRSAKPRSRQ
jgi:multidrug efflux pump subunit AcrB